jgi:hypothetical protein
MVTKLPTYQPNIVIIILIHHHLFVPTEKKENKKTKTKTNHLIIIIIIISSLAKLCFNMMPMTNYPHHKQSFFLVST